MTFLKNNEPRSKNITFLKCFFPVVEGISDFLGSACEVVLHDISNPEHSIIKIKNGHITGRKIRDPLTDLGLESLDEAKNGLETTGNYNPTTKNGHLLKSNSINIKDTRGKLVGMLCINLKVGRLQQVEQMLEEFSQEIRHFYFVKDEKTSKAKDEHFETNLWSVIQKMIEHSIKETGKPIKVFNREEMLALIKRLDEKGIFHARGAIYYVARSVKMSTSSIYRLLGELRSNSKKTFPKEAQSSRES